MRMVLITLACAVLISGMWLAGLAFYEDAPDGRAVATSETLRDPRQGFGAKIAVGVALIGGGVVMLYIVTRRR